MHNTYIPMIVFSHCNFYGMLNNNHIKAQADLVKQLRFIVPVNSWNSLASSELLLIAIDHKFLRYI